MDPTENITKKSYEEIRKDYYKARKQERDRLKKLLMEDKKLNERYQVMGIRKGWDEGRSNYTSSGTLKVPYDLSNWLTITIKHKPCEADKDRAAGKEALIISLQAPDRDNGSKNHHTLMDRIAFIAPGSDGYGPDGKVMAEVTNFQLPLSPEDDRQFVNEVNSWLDDHDGM